MSAQPQELFGGSLPVPSCVDPACKDATRKIFSRGLCKQCYGRRYMAMIRSGPEVREAENGRRKEQRALLYLDLAERDRKNEQARERYAFRVADKMEAETERNIEAIEAMTQPPVANNIRRKHAEAHQEAGPRHCSAGCGRKAPMYVQVLTPWSCPYCSPGSTFIIEHDGHLTVIAKPAERAEYVDHVSAAAAARYAEAKMRVRVDKEMVL